MPKAKNIIFTVLILVSAVFALNYNVPKASVTPAIDGVVNEAEWSDGRYISMVYPDIVTYPKEGILRAASSAPSDPMDYSLHWYLKWDDNYLYIAARIYDDILVLDERKDEPQICFNLYHNLDATFLTEAIVWNLPANGPIFTNTTDGGALAPNNSNIAGSVLSDGYMIEARLAWVDLDPNSVYQPVADDVHGFGLLCQDHDTDGLRETFLADFGKYMPAAGIANLLTWNTITLTDTQACGDWDYLFADLNKDCRVDLGDFSMIASYWLACTDPQDGACIDDFQP